MTKVLARKWEFTLFAGTTAKYDADWFREQVSEYVMKLLSQKIMVKLEMRSPK